MNTPTPDLSERLDLSQQLGDLALQFEEEADAWTRWIRPAALIPAFAILATTMAATSRHAATVLGDMSRLSLATLDADTAQAYVDAGTHQLDQMSRARRLLQAVFA